MNYKTLKLNILKSISKFPEEYRILSKHTQAKDADILLKIIRTLHKYNIISTFEKNYSILWKINEDIDKNMLIIFKEIIQNDPNKL
jgi:hypothetical protein